MTEHDNVIEFQHVTKSYPGVVALADVSLSVRRGELLSVCGENGAGKSTLVKVLSGVITDYDGKMFLRGKPVRFHGTRDAETAGVSIIHQELNLVEELSVAANVFLGREIKSRWGWLDEPAMERTAERLFADLECQIDPRQSAESLRVGDQQLVEIAKAISLNTEILVMDEPTSALTESEVQRLYRVIERLRETGVTILYISHKMDEVFRLSDRICVLRDGEMVAMLDRSATEPREVTHLMVGRELESVDFGKSRQQGEEILAVENLSLPCPGHARQWRLKNIQFTLRSGEVLGIAGLMGAGRTELLECLFGSSPLPPQGTITVAGQRVRFRHPADARRAGLALVSEDRKRLGLFQQMTVRENITICTLREMVRAGLISRRVELDQTCEVFEKLSVKAASTEAPITSLSGGNQQKTIIGRWLLTRPKVLLLDDPTRGVDVGAKAELYLLMDQLCRDGIGMILTSSELPELLTVCDRILVLSEGRLTAEFSRQEATEEKIMEAATLGAVQVST